jgi:hypothetical protein
MTARPSVVRRPITLLAATGFNGAGAVSAECECECATRTA